MLKNWNLNDSVVVILHTSKAPVSRCLVTANHRYYNLDYIYG